MPTKTIWVEPEPFMEHQGITVYYAYTDDDMDQGRCSFHFTLDMCSDEYQFDVRKLDVPSTALLKGHPPFLSATNPVYANATPEQQAQWRKDWDDWQRNDGGEEQAIKTILRDAIDKALLANDGEPLLTLPETEEICTCAT